MTINRNDKVDVAFVLKNSENNSLIYQHSSNEPITLNAEEPLFDILKVLISKKEDYTGVFQFEKLELKESSIEIIPRNGILRKIAYRQGQIIRFGNSPYKYGLILEVSDNELKLETNNPFRRQNLNLKIGVKKVINN